MEAEMATADAVQSVRVVLRARVSVIGASMLLFVLLPHAHAECPSFEPTTNYATGSGSAAVTSGDFNGDGNLDFAVANRNSNDVSILLGTGAGTFGPQATFAAGSGPSSITTADFNG